MAETARQPLILVADDTPEYRDDIIPDRLGEDLGARSIGAGNVVDACVLAAKHHASSDDPLDLIVLDMHMPLHKDTIEVAKDGGIQFLRAYRLVQCPVVVFTAYWSFCVCERAIRSGATAYVPKQSVNTGDGGTEGGINDLVETCRRLLKPAAVAKPARLPPSDQWLRDHYTWLCQEYPNRWVAFIEAESARAARITGTEREGLFVVVVESEERLQQTMISVVAKLGSVPPIVFVEPVQ
jgi:CheY-like chemotaxis protein